MTDRAEIIRKWWATRIGVRDAPAARALAARLRRAGTVAALAERAVIELAGDLKLREPEQVAALAQVLAEVRADLPGRSLARRLGGIEPALSNLRFQRLIRTEGAELVRLLRRALPMAERACDVGRMGADLLAWSDPDRGEAVRARWCFDYFGATPPERLRPETPFRTETETSA
jgi:CRISPR system Cascade subunit CasB